MQPSGNLVSYLSCLPGEDNCPVLGVGSMVMHATLSPSFSNNSWFCAVIFLRGNKTFTFTNERTNDSIGLGM